MPPELEKKLYHQGIELFNGHEFFDAYEVWEDIWHMAYGLKHQYYQGLIQCAVALEHYRRSNPRGVISLYKSYTPTLEPLPLLFMGLDVPGFLAAMKSALDPILLADPTPEKGAAELDLSRTPTIVLQYDPFETGEAEQYNRPAKF